MLHDLKKEKPWAKLRMSRRKCVTKRLVQSCTY